MKVESGSEQAELYKQIMRDMGNIFASYSKAEEVRLNPLTMRVETIPASEIEHSETSKAFIKKNAIEAFDKLLEKVKDINFKDSEGQTMLMHALSYGFYYGVDKLLQRGADVNIIDNKGYNALMYACSLAHIKYVKLIADKTNDLNLQTKDIGSTALHCLTKNGIKTIYTDELSSELNYKSPYNNLYLDHGFTLQVTGNGVTLSLPPTSGGRSGDGYTINQEKAEKIIKHLVAKGAKIDLVENSTGYSPMFYSIIMGYTYLFKNITDSYKIDWLKIDPTGHQGLVIALALGNMNLAKEIIQNNKDIFKNQMAGGMKVIHHLIGHADKIPFLIQNGADINAKNSIGQTPLYLASLNGLIDTVKLLIQHKANHDIPTNSDGLYPIHAAIHGGYLEVVKTLATPANINKLSDKEGMSPLYQSLGGVTGQQVKMEIVNFLLANGANPHLAKKDGNTPMHLAANKGDLQSINMLIAAGAKIDIQNSEGMTPLYLASKYGLADTVELLLQHQANHNIPAANGAYPIHIAIRNGHLEVVKALATPANIDKLSDKEGISPLYYSLGAGGQQVNVEIVSFLLAKGANPNLAKKDGNTPMHLAASKGDLQSIKMFIAAGAKINVQNAEGMTPIYVASLIGLTDTVKLLLQYKANHDIPNGNGFYPIHAAIHNGHLEVVKTLATPANINKLSDKEGASPLYYALGAAGQQVNMEIVSFLLANGANPNLAKKDGNTPMHLAAGKGDLQSIKMLITAGAKLNAQNADSITPLYEASRHGWVDTAKLLQQHKANHNIANNVEGFYPVHAAVHNGHLEVVKILATPTNINKLSDRDGASPLYLALGGSGKQVKMEIVSFLLANGADPNLAIKNGNAPMHLAASKGDLQSIKMLITAGAKLNAQNADGITPLYEVSRQGYVDIVKLLLQHKANPDTPNSKGFYPIHAAVHSGNLEVVKTLVTPTNVNKLSDRDGASLLYLALGASGQQVNMEIVSFLLANSANPNLATKTDDTPMHLAAGKGDLQSIKMLIAAGAKIDAQNADGITPLYEASRHGWVDTVKLLQQHKANHNIANNVNGFYPIHAAVHNGNLEVVKTLITPTNINKLSDRDSASPLYLALGGSGKQVNMEIVSFLLSNDANPNLAMKNGSTPMHLAAEKGDLQSIKMLIAAGAKINVQNAGGMTPLYVASLIGLTDTVKLLLQHKANPDTPNSKGFYPIHAAIHNGHLEVVKILATPANINKLSDKEGISPLYHSLGGVTDHQVNMEIVSFLLANGADPNLGMKKTGDTPMHIAVSKGDLQSIKMLITAGAKIDVQNGQDETPLCYASLSGLTDTVKLLLQHKANPDTPNSKGFYPIHAAIHNGNLEVVKILATPANINKLSDKEGASPLCYALGAVGRQVSMEIVSFLLANSANPNLAMKNGNTPMHLAAEKGDLQSIKMLIDVGAKIDVQNTEGVTPLYFAAMNGLVDTVKLLLQHKAKHDIPDGNGSYPIHAAIDRGHLETVKTLATPTNINKLSDKEGVSPLYYSLGADGQQVNMEMVSFLLSKGANPNLGMKLTGDTPMHRAYYIGNLKAIELLIKSGADLNAQNNDKQTPLHLLLARKEVEIKTKLLILESYKAKYDLTLKDKDGKAALDYVSEHYGQVIEILNNKSVSEISNTFDSIDDSYNKESVPLGGENE